MLYGQHYMLVASTVAASLIGVVTWGSLAGSMLPFVMRGLGFDPAASSAPFVATLVDVTGLVIYFSVALAILLAKHNVITPEVITGDLHPGEKSAAMPPAGDRLALFVSGDLERYYGKLYETVIAEVEKDLIVSALRKVGGNQVKAAQLLGISRVMLHDRLEKYGIKTETIVQQAEAAT